MFFSRKFTLGMFQRSVRNVCPKIVRKLNVRNFIRPIASNVVNVFRQKYKYAHVYTCPICILLTGLESPILLTAIWESKKRHLIR